MNFSDVKSLTDMPAGYMPSLFASDAEIADLADNLVDELRRSGKKATPARISELAKMMADLVASRDALLVWLKSLLELVVRRAALLQAVNAMAGPLLSDEQMLRLLSGGIDTQSAAEIEALLKSAIPAAGGKVQ